MQNESRYHSTFDGIRMKRDLYKAKYSSETHTVYVDGNRAENVHDVGDVRIYMIVANFYT